MLLTARRRPLLATGVALIIAGVLWAVYGAASGVLHSTVTFTPPLAGLDQLGPTLREAIGVFGSLNVRLPSPMYLVWGLGVVGLVTAALASGSARERIVLLAVCAAALGFPVLFYAWEIRGSGFGMQGRYVLPILILVPMLAGELLEGVDRHGPGRARQGGARARRPVAALAAIGVGLFHLAAWWINADAWARTSATGLLGGRVAWSPPAGWAPWLATAAAGCAACLAAARLTVPAAASHPRRRAR